MKKLLLMLGTALALGVIAGCSCPSCGSKESKECKSCASMKMECKECASMKAECKKCATMKNKCPSCACMKNEFKMLSTAEFKTIVDNKSSLIFDARVGKYDTGERIPGAKSLSADSTAEEVAKAIPDKNASIVTYCANLQCPASAALAAHLKKLGYTNIMEYPEGIDGWKKAGNKVEKAK